MAISCTPTSTPWVQPRTPCLSISPPGRRFHLFRPNYSPMHLLGHKPYRFRADYTFICLHAGCIPNSAPSTTPSCCFPQYLFQGTTQPQSKPTVDQTLRYISTILSVNPCPEPQLASPSLRYLLFPITQLDTCIRYLSMPWTISVIIRGHFPFFHGPLDPCNPELRFGPPVA